MSVEEIDEPQELVERLAALDIGKGALVALWVPTTTSALVTAITITQ